MNKESFMKQMRRFAPVLACLALATVSAFGQTNLASVSNFVSSSFGLGAMTIGGSQFSGVNLVVVYNVNLSPESYITAAQLKTDVQGFVAAYPTPADPPEAIGSSVLGSLLTKYPQTNGGEFLLEQVVVSASGATTSVIEVVMGSLGPTSAPSTAPGFRRPASPTNSALRK
jgi:hypothetical protein